MKSRQRDKRRGGKGEKKQEWNAECWRRQENSRVSGPALACRNWLVSELLCTCRGRKDLSGSRST